MKENQVDYSLAPLPFLHRKLPCGTHVAVSGSSDHVFLDESELNQLQDNPDLLPIGFQAELKSKFFLKSASGGLGSKKLLLARQAAKNQTINSGPSLHIIVPTLQCAHSCKYCQVSRSLEGCGFTISITDLDLACESIFQSKSETITVEFQGGDPLIRFDLVKHAVLKILDLNKLENKSIRFVIASTLHQLTEEMCTFFKEHSVYLSTSVDGPFELHNKNRPIAGKNSYERTLAGIDLARNLCGYDSVSALMTTTKESLSYPESIVDEYVKLGFSDIFIRPLSSYGFAKRKQNSIGYTQDDFFEFYKRCLDRIFYWNKKGVEIREVYASIIFNKLLSTFDSGYVDLQSPTGAGVSVLVYNYDGYVFPSDEARMIVETGDSSLALGRIGTPLDELLTSNVQKNLIKSSSPNANQSCMNCAYNAFCAHNPVDAYAEHGDMFTDPSLTEHCSRHMRLFDFFLSKLKSADDFFLDLAFNWATPPSGKLATCVD